MSILNFFWKKKPRSEGIPGIANHLHNPFFLWDLYSKKALWQPVVCSLDACKTVP